MIKDCIKDFADDDADVNKLLIESDSKSDDNLKTILGQLIKKHDPEYDTSLTYLHLKKFERLCFNKEEKKPTQEDLITSIRFLSQLLHEHFDVEVFVLIDEYDRPINSLINHPEPLEDVTLILKQMFRLALKNKEHVKKSYMTGILRITKVFAEINNFTENGMFDKKYAEDFGFTNEEVSNILKEHLEFSDKEEEKQQKKTIKSFYNGYCIGGKCFYNPWSIINCLSNKEIKPYWVQADDTTLILFAFQQINEHSNEMDNFEKFLKLGYYEIPNPETINTRIINLDSIRENSETRSFWVFMLLNGYFTLSPNEENKLLIPNEEGTSEITKILWIEWSKKKFHTLDLNSLFKDYVDSVGNIEKLESFFKTKILDNLDDGHKTEADFQILLCGIGTLASIAGFSQYLVSAEVPVFFKIKKTTKLIGKIDYMNEDSSTAEENSIAVYVNEIKKDEKNKDKNDVVDEAIWQIYGERYIFKVLKLLNDHKHLKWTKIVTRGIAFYKNKMNSKWNIIIKEFTHSIEMAKVLDNIFNSYQSYTKLAHESKAIALKHRKAFLDIVKFRTIDDFLLSHSQKNFELKKEIPKEKDEIEEEIPVKKDSKRNYQMLKKHAKRKENRNQKTKELPELKNK